VGGAVGGSVRVVCGGGGVAGGDQQGGRGKKTEFDRHKSKKEGESGDLFSNWN